MLQKGDSIKCHKDKAIEYFEKAASKGSNQAMLNLALNYANGDGVPIHEEKAIGYLYKAALYGNSEAIEILNKFNSMIKT